MPRRCAGARCRVVECFSTPCQFYALWFALADCTASLQIFGPFKCRPPRTKTHFGRIKFSARAAAACIHCHTEPCKTKFRLQQNFGQNMTRLKIAENKHAPNICLLTVYDLVILVDNCYHNNHIGLWSFHNLEPSKLEPGCRLALRRCVEVRCQDVECLSTLSVLCLVIALSDCIYSAFQNYRRVGFLKYFKFGWNFLRIVFGILLRIAPQLLSYSF